VAYADYDENPTNKIRNEPSKKRTMYTPNKPFRLRLSINKYGFLLSNERRLILLVKFGFAIVTIRYFTESRCLWSSRRVLAL